MHYFDTFDNLEYSLPPCKTLYSLQQIGAGETNFLASHVFLRLNLL